MPYRFGCFSFTALADKRRLIDSGYLESDEQQWRLSEMGRQTARKKAVVPLVVGGFCRRHASLRGDALIAEVYRRFPYYAVQSEIVERVLPDPVEREQIASARQVIPVLGC